MNRWHDPWELHRFVDAQEDTYESALAEIQRGSKESHWMWYVFPQLAGLGTSSTARYYAIQNRDEATAYLAHPILGPRLTECAQALLAHTHLTAHQIFGSPDDLKLRSCCTLFAAISPPNSIFQQLLDRYFPQGPDPRTVELLSC